MPVGELLAALVDAPSDYAVVLSESGYLYHASCVSTEPDMRSVVIE